MSVWTGSVAVLTTEQDALLAQHVFLSPVLKALNGKGSAAKRIAGLKGIEASSVQNPTAYDTEIDFDPQWEVSC